MSIELWTLAIALVTSVACALCGSLLLVNRQAMMTEGISHAMFPGLVIAFLFLRDYSSPILIVAAAVSGLVMVWLSQWLNTTRLVDADAGLGIVFACMFSVGILLVSANLRNTHFHADCIIDGNLALAPLDRFVVAGVDLGPKSWVVMLVMLTVCCGFIVLCYKELKLMLFEPLLAKRFGLKPTLLQCIWLAIVSLTTVASFNVAGAILIVALMIAPPAAAYLLSDRLSGLLILSSLIAAVSSLGGFYLAYGLDVAPTGAMAAAAGVAFLLVFALAPKRGFVAVWARRVRQRREVMDCLILDALSRQQSRNISPTHVLDQLGLPPRQISRTVSRLLAEQRIRQANGQYVLTNGGAVLLEKVVGRVCSHKEYTTVESNTPVAVSGN